MPEETLFEDERRQGRAEVAAALRAIADRLDAGEPVTFSSGDRSVTVDPPATPKFEVKVERETSSAEEPGELSVELELEWNESVDGESAGDDPLRIE